MARGSHVRGAVLSLLLAGGPGLLPARPARAASAQAASEAVVKAQFFERFTRFVSGPGWDVNGKAPFVICLLGNNALAMEIERLAGRIRFKERPTRVLRLTPGQTIDARGCHALYLDDSTRMFLSVLLARIRQAPVLTVADTPGFCHRGVLVNMFVEGGFVRFEVNGPALRDTRLKMSSQLLRLARIIESR